VADCEASGVHCPSVARISPSKSGPQVAIFGLQRTSLKCDDSMEKLLKIGVKRRVAVADCVAAVTDCEIAGVYCLSVV
jgi:hypothetical protein